jgi:hypothetical protein
VPVCDAEDVTPSSAGGIACTWIGVGVSKPASLRNKAGRG